MPLLRSRLITLAVASPSILDHYSILKNRFTYQIIQAPIPPERPHDEDVINVQFKNLNIPDNARIIGFVGNLLPAKGCIDYLEAMSVLCRKNELIYGIMVGGELPGYAGYAEVLHQKIKENGLSDRVHLVGYQRDVCHGLNPSICSCFHRIRRPVQSRCLRPCMQAFPWSHIGLVMFLI